ncbi:MAG: Arm DNA-binding domain-containing protein [Synergistales bacterium]|nr:Arm DNA-binding domain-containing protein [Synergistales bacterium]MDY6400891.1 Arm DNA-binding domain-containing protein [Synergistales bacterium]MDY6404023.1 Arm DNA-binding domain-containing protein [Synergistales bacterium]MDY6411028.1 Arm DNA-binding domain-containing protein [Synergistales bacterium]MDY6414283.1 Arm DNA-binding domain-containing protein [Synergistales bacterium]
MALTDIQVKALKLQDKKYSVSDGRGLILEVRPNGAKYWILRTWSNGKEKRRHLGATPQLSVKDARVTFHEESENENSAYHDGDLLIEVDSEIVGKLDNGKFTKTQER